MESKHVDLDGPVHYLDFGGEGPPLVCVHGLAGSAVNWLAAGPALAERHRVVALDLRGFGRTPMGPGSRLADNLRLLDRFLRQVIGAPATLVGNSMGGLLSVVQAASSPETVSRLVLVDPALPWRGRRPFDPRLLAFFAAILPPLTGEAILASGSRRLGAEGIVTAVLDSCCVQPGRVPDALVRALVDQERERLKQPRTHRALAQATRSLVWALTRKSLVPMYERVRVPAFVVQGAGDRLVPAAFSEAIGLRYGWEVVVLPDIGHVPMMEAPDDFLRLTLAWLASHQPAVA